ncbi:MAG: tRNA-dihydrouridine synthase family protein [Oscillospiraceae bacterium]|nr:tRNA-dihydrouridine synthase family protein [Oscillospiraceae bacterium]
MELSFAPMEGITYSIYRRVHAELFPGADLYYAPFIAPDSTGKFKAGNLRDVLPENNAGIKLVPQLLCNAAAPFLAVARELADLGYEEVNFNIGCPSGTVVAKHKGAGMLGDPVQLDACLADIFSRCPLRVSIKTRLGLHGAEEFPAIVEIYRKYPLSRLIVHVRDRDGMYKSKPDREAFAAVLDCPFPVEYNGNIFTPADLDSLVARYPALDAAMLGRGAVTNPALFREFRGGEALTVKELQAFHDRLTEEYLASGLAPNFTVSRMKELWFYQLCMFPESDRAGKAILKARTLSDYRAAVSALFANVDLDPTAGFNK